MAFETSDAGEAFGATDEKLWRELTLGLLWTRSCPDYFDDDEVSDGLRKWSSVVTLPWSIEDEALTWKEIR
jgi:hypothetical protein